MRRRLFWFFPLAFGLFRRPPSGGAIGDFRPSCSSANVSDIGDSLHTVECAHFFVPHRLIWSDWFSFWSSHPSPSDDYFMRSSSDDDEPTC